LISVPGEKTGPDHSFVDHGNCCASKALGWTVGVAKEADLVAILSGPTLADLLLSNSIVLQDIQQNRLYSKAVVSVSLAGNCLETLRHGHYSNTFFIVNQELYPDFNEIFKLFIKDYITLGVVFVCASGNDGVTLNKHNGFRINTKIY